MAVPRFFQLLHRMGWEFWLPLPLIATLFWVGGQFVATQVLSRPYESVNKLRADGQRNIRLSVAILVMNAEIDRRRGITTIFVKSTDSTLKDLEYQFPTTQASQVEEALARELEIPVEKVRKRIGYRLKD